MGKETDVILELEISGDPDEKILDVGGLKPEGKVAYTTLETWHVETVIAPRPSRVWRGNLKKKKPARGTRTAFPRRNNHSDDPATIRIPHRDIYSPLSERYRLYGIPRC